MPASELDIAIVGGGAAGIAAARRLARSGHSIRLFEASPRLGGRAWSQEIRGFKLDLGAGWLHSADRNAWVKVAEASGIAIDRTPAAWGVQYRDLGFSRAEQSAARKAFEDFAKRLAKSPPASDRASDGLEPGQAWNTYVAIIVGFISGAPPDRISAADYSAYDEASTALNWRVASGYGDLVAQSHPAAVPVSLATPIESLEFDARGVSLRTHAGVLRARAVILAVPTTVLADDSIKLPGELAPWREAAAQLPLGNTEKFFLEIAGDSPFEADKQVLGNPRDPGTASYYLRPFGLPVVECFLSADGTKRLDSGGPATAFAFAVDQLAALFGSDIRRILRPLVASNWSRMTRIGGAYSYALPGQQEARRRLATPFEQRVFIAGEATSETDYSTVHGAHDSGIRAAEEVLRALAAEPNQPTALHSSHGQAQVAAPT